MLDFFQKQKIKIVIIAAIIIIIIFVILGLKSIFSEGDTVNEIKAHNSTNSTNFDLNNLNNTNNVENTLHNVVDPTLPAEGGADLGKTQS